MTVASTISRVDYAGNGITTAFSVPFYFLANTHLIVYRTQISTGITTTLALTTDYTVSGAGTPSGGTLTCVIAPTSDQRLSILRNVPLTQEVDYQTNDPFPAATHEAALDKLTMEVQQVNEALGRSVTISPASTGVSTVLPSPAAGTVVGWDATGTSLTNVDPTLWAGILASEYTYSQTFNGTGAQTAFTLSSAPGAISNTDVYVGGVHQTPTLAYTLSGSTVTFTSAPPSGTNNIQIKWNTVMGQAAVQPYATAAASSASAASASASSASTSASNASSSASAAATSASNASTSASNAATSASTATTQASNASSSASAAATSASNALTYSNAASSSMTSAANSATAAAGYLAPATSTSSTSVTIGTGSKSFTVETAKQWVAGMPIKIAVTASPSTNYMTGTVTSYNSGTGALVVNVTAVGGSGTYAAWSLSLSSGGGASLTTSILRSRFLTSGTTYTPASDVAAFYAQVYGATGGASGASLGGIGGPGYSEKYYPAPSGSYTYSIGASGSPLGTAGGSTTFDVMTVTGSGGVTTTTGSSGGSASGGDYNAGGGSGGNFSSIYGGCGGAGSRAGVGGIGGNGGGISGGGGTGGNNASGVIAGGGATSTNAGAIAMPWGTGVETFLAGNTFATGGAAGCPLISNSFQLLVGSIASAYPFSTASPAMVAPVFNANLNGAYIPYPYASYSNASTFGKQAVIVIIEVLK